MIKLSDKHTKDYMMVRNKDNDEIAILEGNYARLFECISIKELYYPEAIRKSLDLSKPTVYFLIKQLETNNIIKRIIPNDVELGKVVVPEKLKEFLKQRGYNNVITAYTTKYKQIKNNNQVINNEHQSKIKPEEHYESLKKQDMPYHITIILSIITLIFNLILILPSEMIRIFSTITLIILIIYNYINRKFFK